jgi:signal peptidase II
MNKFVFVVVLAAAVVSLDQGTKWIIQSRMHLYESIPVIDSILNITYVRNSGGAFGFLRNLQGWFRLPFFIGVSIIAVGALLFFVRQIDARQHLLLFALGGILGGALGNLIDRMKTGMVVDFLDVHWRAWYWPTFNVADSFITMGVMILLIHSLFAQEPKRSSA